MAFVEVSPSKKSSWKSKIQKFGGTLSAMVMPNIGAFIAWGLLTAFFIPTGWIPNEYFAELIGPSIKYMLPLLIGYTAGTNIYGGRRGGVIGVIATMGVVIGAEQTMLVGGMFMGALGAWGMKKIDNLQVSICKLVESSGNEQFYVRLVRTDEKSHGSILEYDCFQTKHLSKEECLSRAWFSASIVARFCGLSSMDEVNLYNLSEDEIVLIKKAMHLLY